MPAPPMNLTGRLALANRCISSDAYDEAAFRLLLARTPSLERCQRRGAIVLCAFPELMRDIFCLLFKVRPALADRTRVRAGLAVNRYLLATLSEDPEVERLRARTVLDEEASGAATLALAAQILKRLEREDLAQENQLFALERAIDSGKLGEQACDNSALAVADTSRSRAAGQREASQRRMSYDIQQKLELAAALQSYRGFARLIFLVERIAAVLDLEDPTRWRSPEVYDISLGRELAQLLPGELVALRAAGLRRDFLRRLAEGALLTYRVEDRHVQGPLALLVDASDSMAGEKELAAKALAIALWLSAAKQGQETSVIVFGPPTAPLWRVGFCHAPPTWRQVTALAETFLGGGTDFARPILAAIDSLSRKAAAGGQILLVTDGLCDAASEWVAQVRTLKAKRRLRVLTLLIDLDRFSEQCVALFSDRVIRWSQLAATSGTLAVAAQREGAGQFDLPLAMRQG